MKLEEKRKLTQILDNPLRLIDAKNTIARKKSQNPETLRYYNINGIRLDILDEAIKKYESSLRRKHGDTV